MQYLSAAVAALAAAAVASAAEIQVLVGADGLAYTPSSVNASTGDTINFVFRAKNHTVTQSTFANPCEIQTTPKAGIDSGFQAVAAGATEFPSWSITVDDASTPLWFFCKQTNPANHCQLGMVFAVNPTAEKSFDAFQANAKASASGASSGAVPGATGSSALPTSAGASTGLPGYGLPATTAAAPASSAKAGNATATPAPPKNGATRLGGGASMLLALAGLAAGLIL